jgi:SAM-dependent methyltransferase
MLMGGRPQKVFGDFLKEAIRGAHDILDIGTSQRFAKELRPYEHWFRGKNYIAAGYHPIEAYGPYNCDCHQDIHEMTFGDDSFDAVLCVEVIEHVANPLVAASELFRVLRPKGRLFLTTPFLFQYHGKGKTAHSPDNEHYPDYWRFTHQGLEQLFRQFGDIKVRPLDGPIEFRLNQFYLRPLLARTPVRQLLDWIDRPRPGKASTRHVLLAIKE